MFRRTKAQQTVGEVAWASTLTPDAFIRAVDDARNALYKGDQPQEPSRLGEFEFVRDDARLVEARIPAEVALAFARAEVRPRDRGLGIPPGPNAVHALGHQLRTELEGASDEQRDAVASAILDILAWGYVTVLVIQAGAPSLFADATAADDVWAVTVANFRRGALLAAGLPPGRVKTLEEGAGTRLVWSLRNSGILTRQVRVVKIPKIQQLACYYANAGGLLRIAQLNWLLNAPLRNLQAAAFAESWPYSAYAIM